MPKVDPELWVLVHGGFIAMETWPDAERWAGTRAVLRALYEATASLEDWLRGETKQWGHRLHEALGAAIAEGGKTIDEARAIARRDRHNSPMAQLEGTFSDFTQANEDAVGALDFWESGGSAGCAVDLWYFLEAAAVWLYRTPHEPDDYIYFLPVTGYGLPEGRFEDIFAEEFAAAGGADA